MGNKKKIYVAITIILLLCLSLSYCCALTVYSQQSNDYTAKIYKIVNGDMKSRGCRTFAFAHAVQIATGRSDSDKSILNDLVQINYKLDPFSAGMSPYKNHIQGKYSGVKVECGLGTVKKNGKKFTDIEWREAFGNGWVYIINTWGHFALAADYVVCDSQMKIVQDAGGVKLPDGYKMYVKIIDSSSRSSFYTLAYNKTKKKWERAEDRAFHDATWYTLSNDKLVGHTGYPGDNADKSGQIYYVEFSTFNRIWLDYDDRTARISGPGWSGHQSIKYNDYGPYCYKFKSAGYIYGEPSIASNDKKEAKKDFIVIVDKKYTGDYSSWLGTKDGKFVRESDLTDKTAYNKELDKVKSREEFSTNVRPNNDNTGLYYQPYVNSICVYRVSDKTDLTVKAIILNNANHYWLEVGYQGGTYYLCANNVHEYFVGPRKFCWPDGTITVPEGKREKGKGLNFQATIRTMTPMTKVTGYVLDGNNNPVKVKHDGENRTYSKSISYSSPVYSFKLGGSVIDTHLKIGWLNEGAYRFAIDVTYKMYKNAKSDTDYPIEERTERLIEKTFTIGNAKPLPSEIKVTGLTLSNSTLEFQVGGTSNVAATVAPQNATNNKVEWVSSNTNVVTVKDGKVTAVGKGIATITATALGGNNVKATCSITVVKKVTDIKVQPANMVLYANESTTLIASIEPSDASNPDVEWYSSNGNVTVNKQTGVIAAVSAGKATITAKAKDNSGKQGTCSVEVRSYVDTVSVAGDNSVNVGATIKLTATTTPNNDYTDKNVIWTSSNENIAIVDATSGIVTGRAPGSVTITAKATDRGTVFGSKTITVKQPVTSISITGPSDQINAGNTLQLSAQVLPSNASNKVVEWKSNDENVVTVSQNGLVTAIGGGKAEITAKAKDESGIISAAYSIKVKGYVTDIIINGDNRVPINQITRLSATIYPEDAANPNVFWSSSDETIATVDQNGEVTGLKYGTVTITVTATDRNEVSKSCNITVYQPLEEFHWIIPETVLLGQTVDISPTIIPSNASCNILWSLSTIYGKTSALMQPGSSTLYYPGKYFQGKKASIKALQIGLCEVNLKLNNSILRRVIRIVQPVESIVVEDCASIGVNGTLQLNYTITPSNAFKKTLLWSSSNTSVATVDEYGVVTGQGVGTAVITASSTDGSGVISNEVTVSVEKQISVAITSTDAVYIGKPQQIAAVVYSDIPLQDYGVVWTSSDEHTAIVNDNGVITGLKNGTVTITATSKEDTRRSASVTIAIRTRMTSLRISGEENIDEGFASELAVEILPFETSNSSLVWQSDSPEIATVTQDGVVNAITPGEALITATSTDGSNLSSSLRITVYPTANMISLNGDTELHPTESVRWTAEVFPSDSRNKNVTWSSSDTNVATVDQTGKVTGIANGTAEITATSDFNEDIFATRIVTITTQVNNITITGDSVIDEGHVAQLSALVEPESASNKEIVWNSDNLAVVTVNANGQIEALKEGAATVTASAVDGSQVAGQFHISVYPLPRSVSISGKDEMLIEETTQLSAVVLPANTRNKNVIWSSSDETVAIVDSTGLVTAVGNGKVVITGIAQGNNTVIDTHQIYVKTLVSSIDLTPPEKINVGDSDTIATEIMPISASNKKLEWTSSDDELAVVDANGFVTALAPGYVTITATAVDGSGVTAEVEIEMFQPVRSIAIDAEPYGYVGGKVYLNAIVYPEDASNQVLEYTINNSDVAEIESITETNGPYYYLNCKGFGLAKITATSTDGSGVSGCTYVLVLPYTELNNTFKEYTVYKGGQTNGTIGDVSLSTDCKYRAAEDRHGAVWNIEYLGGDYATAIGMNENVSDYDGFSLASSVDLNLLRINRTGTDVYRVSCTINGQTDTCNVTIHAVEPASPLPTTVNLSTNTYYARVGEAISINTSATTVRPVGAALPEATDAFLYGEGAFNRYAQVSMSDSGFNVQFDKAGTYSAYVRYSGTNYQYDANVEFVITTEQGTIPPDVEEIMIYDQLKYMLVGETSQFDVSVIPGAADESGLIWSSSDPEVVSVNNDGMMTALTTGTSTITVSADNGVSATGLVIVTETLLSIDWNEDDVIEVYTGGSSKSIIQRVYLTPRASAQLAEAPTWTLNRLEGNNLTLTCEPITSQSSSGQELYGCAIILKSISAIGQTEYELSCSDGEYTASTIIKVHANEVESNLPSMINWSNDTFTGSVNELLSIHPIIQCWPEGTILPDSVLVSIDGDQYWNAALNRNDYSVSRNAMTFSFNEPGVYTANCIYACSNMRFLVPFTVRIADANGIVPVRATNLTLSENEVSVRAGNTVQMKALIAPEDATNKSVVWNSENPAVATVSDTGLITGISNGRTNIWCVPDDTNCAAVKCVVVVEDEFTVVQTDEMDTQYLQGEAGNAIASFKLSTGTAKRIQAAELTPEWSFSRTSGSAADVELTERDGIRYLVVKSLRRGGTDKYSVTCSAGEYSWNGQVTLTVNDLGVAAPSTVSIAQNSYAAAIGEEIELDFTPVCSPSGSAIPSDLRANYIGIGQFYNGLKDSYKVQVLTTRNDKVKVAFRKKGTYLLCRYYKKANLTYTTQCTINVGDGLMNLLTCKDREATVYVGGKPGIAATCVISDNSIEELYGDELIWTAEKLSGDCLHVTLRADQSSAALYVASAFESGEEVWRVSCTFRGITDYIDITIQAVEPEIDLPESATLRQTEFSGMIGNTIKVPLAVQCEPEGTGLPSIEDDAWSFAADGNTEYNSTWSFANNRMNICFKESGYYGGKLVYQSGNVSYSFPISFAITDEESILPSPAQMDISLSKETMTVYPEGVTDVPVVNAVLSDSLDAYSLASIAAYAQSKNAIWSLEVISGNACDITLRKVSSASVQIVLGEMTGIGDVNYRVSCQVEGHQYSAEGTIHVAGETEERPHPEVKQTYFLTSVGTMITIDASFYDKTSNVKLCAGKDSVWDNADALAAMGYDYQTSGDLWMPVFSETGTYTTNITNRISNLICSQEIKIVVFDAKPLPANPSVLKMPKALLEIEEEAFAGVKVNVIDLRETKVQKIQSMAFADNTDLMKIYIPASVTFISTDTFEGCSAFEICCVPGSYADTWAQDNGYPVNYSMD